MWMIKLDNINYTLTGVDIDQNALDIRIRTKKDLDIGILGDLRSINLKENEYDVIYNSYVLEHVKGAERVLENFFRWLQPGGIMIIRFPNRDSVRGLLTRATPFWFHVLYWKYVLGYKEAGKPGIGPFPTEFDKIVSLRGIHAFCKKHRLVIKGEYAVTPAQSNKSIFAIVSNVLIFLVYVITFRRFSRRNGILLYCLEKPLIP